MEHRQTAAAARSYVRGRSCGRRAWDRCESRVEIAWSNRADGERSIPEAEVDLRAVGSATNGADNVRKRSDCVEMDFTQVELLSEAGYCPGLAEERQTRRVKGGEFLGDANQRC